MASLYDCGSLTDEPLKRNTLLFDLLVDLFLWESFSGS